jgi:hypothetical protein
VQRDRAMDQPREIARLTCMVGPTCLTSQDAAAQ